ncbi:tRNA preQ1(34) S-adenosylmethionine ribosyltransferase-isomerase QueA [Patescibacteria group bacterium]
MFTKDFSYNLPKELIATVPAYPRDTSRLMLLDRKSKKLEHRFFNELPDLLSSDYIIVFNKTRVFPARLEAKVDERNAELLLLKKIDEKKWQCMVKPGKKFAESKELEVVGKKESIRAQVVSIYEDGTREIEFKMEGNFDNWIEENGSVPLPPYIKDSKAGMAEYQTVYAEETGSIAAPTAGLHFTDEVFEKLKSKGIETAFVTLHVGRGTFLPVKSEKIEDHVMHSESYEMTEETAEMLNEARTAGKKILAVGTTSVRVLESNFKDGSFHPERTETDIFIYPGYEFKAIDCLLTNFHLPESTLIMLISALADKEFIFEAYEEAIREKYRFYSFGDAMLIL